MISTWTRIGGTEWTRFIMTTNLTRGCGKCLRAWEHILSIGKQSLSRDVLASRKIWCKRNWMFGEWNTKRWKNLAAGFLVVAHPITTDRILKGSGLFSTKTANLVNESQTNPASKTQKIKKHNPKRNFIMRFLQNIWKFIRVFMRTLRLYLTFTPFILTFPLTYLSSGFTNLWWSLLLIAIQNSGPTFIKLGQWASTRRDLFSHEFCSRFSRLQRKNIVHDWPHTKRILAQAFGERWRELLVKFDNNKKPIGSGCVAQVYKAYMNPDMISDKKLEVIQQEQDDDDDPFGAFEIFGFFTNKDGEEDDSNYNVKNRVSIEDDTSIKSEDTLIPVAVKVLHPGVHTLVRRDVAIITGAASLIEFLIPRLKWMDLKGCVEEFALLMEKQLDMCHEAENLDVFSANFADVPSVKFPKPIWPFVKHNVLVETFEEGKPISKFITHSSEDVEERRRMHSLKQALGDISVDSLLKMIFIDNFVHGDLHPGNILVQNADSFQPQEKSKTMMLDLGDTLIVNVNPCESSLRLVLLDTGIVATLSEKDQVNFRAVFTAVVEGKGETVAELLLKHAPYSQCEDLEGFKMKMAELVNKARSNTLKLSKVQVAELLSSVFSMVSEHKVKIDRNFTAVVLAVMVLEGLGRSLDPDLDLMKKAAPVLLAETGRGLFGNRF